MSIDGGATWLSDSATICVTAGATVDLAARTLMTVTSGQTQAWSFSLKHSAPWAPIFGGSFLVTSVTTDGTGTATVQAGNPPDRNTTAIRTGGFIQGIVIDDDEGNTLPPATDFVTARACYRLTVPTASGTYRDLDSNGAIDITDAIVVLNALFISGSKPECVDAADINDDIVVDVSDSVALLNFLFIAAPPPPPPFPGCGFDPTDDLLSCRRRGMSGGVLCPDNHSHD